MSRLLLVLTVAFTTACTPATAPTPLHAPAVASLLVRAPHTDAWDACVLASGRACDAKGVAK